MTTETAAVAPSQGCQRLVISFIRYIFFYIIQTSGLYGRCLNSGTPSPPTRRPDIRSRQHVFFLGSKVLNTLLCLPYVIIALARPSVSNIF